MEIKPEFNNVIKKEGGLFLSNFGEYIFKENAFFQGNGYDEYLGVFQLKETNRLVKISLSDYNQDKITITIKIFENNNSINVSDYIINYLKNKSVKLIWYDKVLLKNNIGNITDEKLVSFFEWFLEVIDERLINFFKGKDWMDIPFDWRG